MASKERAALVELVLKNERRAEVKTDMSARSGVAFRNRLAASRVGWLKEVDAASVAEDGTPGGSVIFTGIGRYKRIEVRDESDALHMVCSPQGVALRATTLTRCRCRRLMSTSCAASCTTRCPPRASTTCAR